LTIFRQNSILKRQNEVPKMIYRLEFENFYSFRDRQIVDLTVPKTTPQDPERFTQIFEGSTLRAPKVVAVYGANGSGKSTVLKALAAIIWFAKDSFQHTAPGLPCERFNDEESAGRSVRLAIEYGSTMVLSKETRTKVAEGGSVQQGVFRYELEFGVKDGAVLSVATEILRRKPHGRGKWIRVFERQAGKKLIGSSIFPLSGYAKVIDKIREDASVISTLALFAHEPSQVLIHDASTVFSNILVEKTELSDNDVVRYLVENPSVVTALNNELQRIDVGIQSMEIVQTTTGPVPQFQHDGLRTRMPWGLESHGTKSFIRMFPWILGPLSQGGIAIIDELDNSIHPLVLPEILRWFYDAKRNPLNAQLWTTCHSVSLMEDLMKEEIVLCEKDRQGRSEVYTLTDMKAVRRGDNIYKKYLGGVYGGVPHIG
jgi:AAA15 family ATPase/GTPase